MPEQEPTPEEHARNRRMAFEHLELLPETRAQWADMVARYEAGWVNRY